MVLSCGVGFELVTGDQDTPLIGDRVFLAEAIRNLTDNALKCVGPGVPAIKVRLGGNGKFAPCYPFG